MNIEIPSFIKDEPIEGAIVFAALIYRLCKPHGFHKTRYFLDSRDMRATMQRNLPDPSVIFGKYSKWVRMGKCSDTHIFFDWQVESMETEMYYIKAEELKQVWTFLLARIQGDKNLVEDWTKNHFPPRAEPFLERKEDQFLFQTTGLPAPGQERRMMERRKRREEEQELANKEGKRGRGRPKGSKNKR